MASGATSWNTARISADATLYRSRQAFCVLRSSQVTALSQLTPALPPVHKNLQLLLLSVVCVECELCMLCGAIEVSHVYIC